SLGWLNHKTYDEKNEATPGVKRAGAGPALYRKLAPLIIESFNGRFVQLGRDPFGQIIINIAGVIQSALFKNKVILIVFADLGCYLIYSLENRRPGCSCLFVESSS